MTLPAVDTHKRTMNVNLPYSIVEYIERHAAVETGGNRSIALAQMLRKLAQYEQAEAEGRIIVKKQAA